MATHWGDIALEVVPVVAVLVLIACPATWRVVFRLGRGLRARYAKEPPAAQTRPIELVAQEARRLGHRFRHPPRGTSFAKWEGIRRAYDAVLVECCGVLGIEHLLVVLPPGPELDAERRRVELRLSGAGFQLDYDNAGY